MGGSGSFRRRLFLVLLAFSVLPAAIGIGGGTAALRRFVSGSGTAGPWASVAESGEVLLDRIEALDVADPDLRRAAEAHREALSESLRLSRLYALVTERLLRILPVAAALGVLLLAVPVLLVARSLAHALSEPVREMAGWTERIARGDPLPEEAGGGAARRRPVREFRILERSLRSMDRSLREARVVEVEGARLRSWTEMARRVAHELKNPLTPMRLAVSSLRRGGGPEPALTVLEEEIARLDDLARSFAQFGRMPEGPPSDVDAEALIRQVAPGELADGRVRLRVEEGVPPIRARPEPLRRVVANLLGNAMESVAARRDPPSDDLWADVSIRAGASGTVVLRIEDRGPGIPDGVADRIWLPDFTTRNRGSGLGLALVKQTVEADGGTARAWNLESGGACFEIELPAGGPARAGAGAQDS